MNRPRALERDEEGRKHCAGCKQWLPVADFWTRTAAVDGLQGSCKTCKARSHRAWIDEQPKKPKPAPAPRYIDTPEARRKYKLKHLYQLSLEEFDRMLQDQGAACAICRSPDPRGTGWCVDHDHACCPGKRTCGKCTRGILCVPCNKGIGILGDTAEALERAAAYLRKEQP